MCMGAGSGGVTALSRVWLTRNNPSSRWYVLKLFPQVLTVRTVHEQLVQLLSSSERQQLRTSEAFAPFSGLNPLHQNPYTEPLWRAAVTQYERGMAPAEQRIAGKLRQQFRDLAAQSHQVNTALRAEGWRSGKISASQPEGPRFNPWPCRGLNSVWPSFLLKFTQLSILPRSVKWVPAYMDRIKAAARGAYVCFRSAGGNLIIVMRLWAHIWERRNINAALYLFLTSARGILIYQVGLYCPVTRVLTWFQTALLGLDIMTYTVTNGTKIVHSSCD